MGVIAPTYQSGFYAPPRGGRPKYPSLWRGCVGAWAPCLGPTGGVLRDWSGRGNHGTLTNMDQGTSWVASDGRYALGFDGVNDYTATQYIFPTTNFTYAFWVKSSSAGSANRPFGNADSTRGLSGVGVIYGYPSSAGLYFIARVGSNVGTYDIATTPPGIASGWHHVAVTLSSVYGMIVYWDGVVIGTNTASTTITNEFTTNIGRNGDGTDAFFGTLDDVFIYGRVLTQREVKLLASRRGIACELAPRNVYSKPASFSAAWARRQNIIIGGGIR